MYIYIYIMCVWNFWTQVKPLLLLLFELSDFSRGTWQAIRDHVQRSYRIVCDTEPDQLCVPAPFSPVYGKRPSQEPPRRFSCHVCLDLQLQSTSFSAQLVQSETAVTGQLPIYFCFGILQWNPVSGYSHDPSPGIRKRWSVFLHARCIPHDNSIRQFWGSVCVWTIWRDVKLLLGFGCTFGSLFEQKNWALCDWPSSTKLGHRAGYLDWPSRRTCIFAKSAVRQWRPAKPRTGQIYYFCNHCLWMATG